MNSPINDGGPAFPCDFNMSTFEHGIKGMSLRDYFAGQALQAIMTGAFQGHFYNKNGGGIGPKQYAEAAYANADAMLEARNQPKP